MAETYQAKTHQAEIYQTDKYQLEILSLGGFEIRFAQDYLMDKLSSKACGLLCYLALNNEKAATRDELAGLFWNDESGESARYNLRFTIWQIKRLFKEKYNVSELITGDRNRYRLNQKITVVCDAIRIRELFRQAEKGAYPVSICEQIRQLYRGDFLENYEFKNCFKFNDWIFYEKEDLQRLHFKVLHALADHYVSVSDHQKAIDIYREMIRVNPFIEELHVALIRVYLVIGDRSNAITQYERCCTILRDDLNVAPSESTKQVYDEIVSGEPLSANREKVESSLSLTTECIKADDLPFYWLWSILEEVLNTFDVQTLREIPKQFWIDVSVYSSRVCEIYDFDDFTQAKTPLERIRSFSSLLMILKALSARKTITLYVKRVEYMDKESGLFYQFLLANLEKTSLRIHLIT